MCGAQEDTFNKVRVAGAGHGRVREVQSRKAYLVGTIVSIAIVSIAIVSIAIVSIAIVSIAIVSI